MKQSAIYFPSELNFLFLSYDTPGSLSTHKKWHHSDQKRETHVCHICAKSFATRAGLNEHMASIHQPREINQVQCAECGKW